MMKNKRKIKRQQIKETVAPIFKTLNISTSILDFDPTKQGNDFDKQPYYQFWHLL